MLTLFLEFLVWALLVTALVLIWRWLRPVRSMQLTFSEEKKIMPDLAIQEVEVHAGNTYHVAGGATGDDGSALALTNLVGSPETSTIGVCVDSDASDDLVDFAVNADAAVGAADTVTFDAKDEAGEDCRAIAHITVVAPDVALRQMALVFSKV